MKPTRAMIERAYDAMVMPCTREDAEDILNAALADAAEPVPGPFVLTAKESDALVRSRCFEQDDGDQDIIIAALDRAVRTLGAPAVEPLSAVEERALTRIEATFPKCTPCFPDGSPVPVEQRGNSEVLASIIRKRFPKPAPVQRTPEQLRDSILTERPAWPTTTACANALTALDELVRRAK